MTRKMSLAITITILWLGIVPQTAATEPQELGIAAVDQEDPAVITPAEEQPATYDSESTETDAIASITTNSQEVAETAVSVDHIPVAPLAAPIDYLVVTAGDAILEVQKDVTAGGTIHLKGSNWKNQAGGGSTITIKLNFDIDGKTGQYQRVGQSILNHPGNNNKDATIFWQITAQDDGTFDVIEKLPADLVAGQGLKLNVASGLVPGDTQRSITTPSLVVNGKPYVEPTNIKGECTPSVSPPQATVAATPSTNNTLRIEAKGFCNTKGGGAKVAIKIDEGRVERLDTSVHDNQTIWAIVDADPRTGDFSIDLPLPDGTTSGKQGTKTPFGEGEHTIRLLSGSLQEGDVVASVPPRGTTLSFTVGQYQPTAVPDPVNYEQTLTSATQNGVTARKTAAGISVTIPQAKENDWIYASAYLENGSPRLPWRSQWFQVNAEQTVLLPATDAIPTGQFRLVLQSGNQGYVGQVVGWVDFKYKDGATANPDGTSTSTSASAHPADQINNSLKGLNSALDGLGVALTDFVKSYNKSVANDATDQAVEVQSIENNDNIVAAPALPTDDVIVPAAGIRNTAAINTSTQPAVAATGVTAGQSVASDPKPTHEPKPPVKTRDELTNDNLFGASGSMTGEELSMKIPQLSAGQWAFLHVYPADTAIDPQPAGWVQLDAQQVVRLETSALPNGEYTISAQSAEDKLVGWVDIVLGSTSEPLAGGTGNQAAGNTTAKARLMNAADWWLLAISLIIPIVYAGGLYIYRRKERHV